VELPPVTPELFFWFGGPLLASLAVACGGFFARRRVVRLALATVGLGGLILSVLWILLALRVEAVVR
jgi:hypothetical protein